MRKLFLVSTVLLCLGSPLFAQDEGEALDIGDSGGSSSSGGFSIEITSTPFSGQSLLDFGSFRVKYQINDDITPRLGLYFDHNSSQSTPDVVTNLSTFTFMPGVEYYLVRDGKFSSYLALDVIVGIRDASREAINASGGATVEGYTGVPSTTNQSLSTSLRGYFQLGGYLAVGFNHQVTPKIYIGSEIGFQLVNTTYSEVTVDGQLFQNETTANTGGLNTINTFKVGFNLN